MKRNTIITGKKFSRLTVLKEVEQVVYGKSKHRMVFCKCDCGNNTITPYSDIKNGHTQSCGCLARENFAKRQYIHGLSRSNFENVFQRIKSRCNKKNNKDYNLYGGRGIKCLWKSFLEFRDDMYESYLIHKKTHVGTNTRIERINNNGNYSKENCKWATHIEQARNRRSTHFLTYKGKTLTCTEWARKLGGEDHLVLSRINNYGWSIKKSVTTPPIRYK